MSAPTSTDLAIMIAVLLDRDRVAAAQIKNHIPKARLIELLDLDAPEASSEGQAVIQDPNPLAELADKK